MKVGIKWLPNRLDPPQILRFQNLSKLPLDDPDPLQHSLGIGPGLKVLNRALEVIEDRKERLHQVLGREPPQIVSFLLRTTSEILKIGKSPKLVLLSGAQTLLQRLDLLLKPRYFLKRRVDRSLLGLARLCLDLLLWLRLCLTVLLPMWQRYVFSSSNCEWQFYLLPGASTIRFYGVVGGQKKILKMTPTPKQEICRD